MKIALTAFQKKVILAGGVTLFTVLGEIGYQLASGTVNLTKAVIFGIVIGGFARVGGAVLSVITTTPEPVNEDQ